MSLIDSLSTSLKRRDEVPNIELAHAIVHKKDLKAVAELMDLLKNKNKDIQHDCIKVLYEIGEKNPKLISNYIPEFVALCSHKNNRMQWGAMHALSAMTSANPDAVYMHLPSIIAAAEKGSVITRDHFVRILIKLCEVKKYAEECFSLYLEVLLGSPENQLPMYAEMALPIISKANSKPFCKILLTRMQEMESDTKKKRIEKILKKWA